MAGEIKHNASSYAHGCRCSVCRAAGTAAKRKQRANKARVHQLSESLRPAPKPVAPKVVELPTSQQQVDTMGLNEQAVREECELSKSADTRQSVVAQAISLARILDDDRLMSMWPMTSKQLQGLMKELQGTKRKINRNLVVVSKMAGRRAI
jgi:hypothetical protein